MQWNLKQKSPNCFNSYFWKVKLQGSYLFTFNSSCYYDFVICLMRLALLCTSCVALSKVFNLCATNSSFVNSEHLEFQQYRIVKETENLYRLRAAGTVKSISGSCYYLLFGHCASPVLSRPQETHLLYVGEMESWVNSSYHKMWCVLLSVRKLIHSGLSKRKMYWSCN